MDMQALTDWRSVRDERFPVLYKGISFDGWKVWFFLANVRPDCWKAKFITKIQDTDERARAYVVPEDFDDPDEALEALINHTLIFIKTVQSGFLPHLEALPE